MVKVSVNGQEVDPASDLPLRVGTNTIRVGIYDSNNPEVLLGQYEIIIIRADDDSVQPQIIVVDVARKY